MLLKAILLAVLVGVSTANDKTLENGAKGSEVVETTTMVIESACIFADDKLFTRRLAYEESLDGADQKTFRTDYYGGIWQVDKDMFDVTQSTAAMTYMKAQVQAIKSNFGIDWSSVKWEDLTIPLHSALANRLYISYQSRAEKDGIPRAVDAQADFWTKYYRPGGDPNFFITRTNALEKECVTNGADIIFLFDGSGSIGSANFNKMKNFAKSVVNSYEVGLGANQTRFGLIQFATKVRREFDLGKYGTQSQINAAIDKMPYMTGGTNTNLGLDEMTQQGFLESNGARPKVENHARVGIVLTDGQSNQPQATIVSALKTHDAGITVVAVGIGNQVNLNELAVIASDPVCLNLILLANFTDMDSLHNIVEKRTCDAPVIIEPNDNSTIELPPGGDQNCKIEISPDGVTVEITTKNYGIVRFYISRSIYPSASYYDEVIEAAPNHLGLIYLPNTKTDGSSDSIFCNIKNGNFSSNISIDIKPGDRDYCKKNKPCQNNGTCHNQPGGQYSCKCRPGFSGKNCESKIDPCKGAICLNQGSCIATPYQDKRRHARSVSEKRCEQCEEAEEDASADESESEDAETSESNSDELQLEKAKRRVSRALKNKRQSKAASIDQMSKGSLSLDKSKGSKSLDNSKGSDSKDSSSKSGSQDSDDSDDSEDTKDSDDSADTEDSDDSGDSDDSHDGSHNSTVGFICQCAEGFTGPRCEIGVDHCSSNPCFSGTCVSRQRGFECKCETGYTGHKCDQPINDCASNPCSHGECKPLHNTFECCCEFGWTGHLCETEINECASSPCVRGTCLDKVNGYICQCPPGYTGYHCEIEIDECASAPCLNGDCLDHINRYECHCLPGWVGTNCEIDVDECESNPCLHGSCVNGLNRFDCICNPGYTGINCEIDIDECSSGPCVHGDCVDKPNGFICTCPPGWTGPLCEIDIDECSSSPCHNGGTCHDDVNSYKCVCPPGFTGLHCETDIDECESSPCVHGQCIDHVNGYSCECQPGYSGVNCEIDIDECESSPCVHGSCGDLVDGYHCVCDAGWTGETCETGIDECESNPCIHGECVDHVNGYTCNCQNGYTGVNCETDIDECASNPCVHGQCEDGVANFICHCPPGWTGVHCEIDVDECESSPCFHGTCEDRENGYVCHCIPGYTGPNCDEDINECLSQPCLRGSCHDRVNSFICICEEGWTGHNCEIDIDECKSSPCQHGTCTDRDNGYICVCDNGYSGTNCDCLTNNCESSPCSNGVCENLIGGFACHCNQGYSGETCEIPPGGSETPAPPTGTYNCEDRNPCTPENAANGDFYFPADNPTEFIQCSDHGQCFVMPCGPGTQWDSATNTCNYSAVSAKKKRKLIKKKRVHG